MERPEVIREWVNEAIETLGKIKPEASRKIVDAILGNLDQPANKVALLLRKEGKQLEIAEKKRLGLSAKTFFSHEALSDLTEEGLQHPLQAHDLTIRRATLAASRAESILDESAMGISQWEVLAPFPDQCAGCKRIDGKMFTKETAEPLGPHDCFRQACAVAFAPKVESIKQHEKPSSVKRQGAKPWWKVW
jgi:hypothetical protein